MKITELTKNSIAKYKHTLLNDPVSMYSDAMVCKFKQVENFTYIAVGKYKFAVKNDTNSKMFWVVRPRKLSNQQIELIALYLGLGAPRGITANNINELSTILEKMRVEEQKQYAEELKDAINDFKYCIKTDSLDSWEYRLVNSKFPWMFENTNYVDSPQPKHYLPVAFMSYENAKLYNLPFKCIEINQSSVDKDFQGMGIGYALYKGLIKYANLNLVALGSHSKGAQKLWARMNQDKDIKVYAVSEEKDGIHFYQVDSTSNSLTINNKSIYSTAKSKVDFSLLAVSKTSNINKTISKMIQSG
jgi:GNAT superfamily N-acetyltransferase